MPKNERVFIDRLRNNKKLGVINGNVGMVQEITENDGVVVLFDNNKIVTYSKEETYQLSLANAITIHKAQGSEYPIVIIPVFDKYQGGSGNHHRNLMYTAMTRAKEKLIIIGSSNEMTNYVNTVHHRMTRLQEKIQIHLDGNEGEGCLLV